MSDRAQGEVILLAAQVDFGIGQGIGQRLEERVIQMCLHTWKGVGGLTDQARSVGSSTYL